MERDMPEVEAHNQVTDLIINVTLNGQEVYRRYQLPEIDCMSTEEMGEELRDMIDTFMESNKM